MGNWLIFVKNSKNWIIFANFGCFAMLRVKKMMFPFSEKAQKGQISASYHYGLRQKWLQILLKTICYGTLEQKTTKFVTKISHFQHQCFWESFCLQVMILEKVANFGNLGEMIFGKPLGCTLLSQSFQIKVFWAPIEPRNSLKWHDFPKNESVSVWKCESFR